MRVLALTRYGDLGASSRVRLGQFLPALGAAGIHVEVAPLLDDAYIRRLYGGARTSPVDLVRAYARRVLRLAAGPRPDVVWVEKEVLSYLPAWAERLLLARAPYVVDYDDATFHTYDRHRLSIVRAALGRKIDHLMRRAAVVVAGNDYLAEHAQRAGARRVDVIPSVVDLAGYASAPRAQPAAPRPRIGWIGSPGSEILLTVAAPALAALVASGAADVALIGTSAAALPGVPHERRTWTEASEAAELARLDIGIMPVWDEPFARGKCGYKLVQYGAAWLPSVASPIGVNREIVVPGETGLLATTTSEWEHALRRLTSDAALRRTMGDAARARIAHKFTIDAVAPRFVAALHAGASR